jgi:hypothetical protein
MRLSITEKTLEPLAKLAKDPFCYSERSEESCIFSQLRSLTSFRRTEINSFLRASFNNCYKPAREAYHTNLQTNDNFLVGADPCVRHEQRRTRGCAPKVPYFLIATRYQWKIARIASTLRPDLKKTPAGRPGALAIQVGSEVRRSFFSESAGGLYPAGRSPAGRRWGGWAPGDRWRCRPSDRFPDHQLPA